MGACVSNDRAPAKWDSDERADLHVQLGTNYLQRDQFETADSELQLALALDPQHSRANHMMAILQGRLKNEGQAERYFRVATRSGTNNFEAHHDYGRFLCQRDRVSEAMVQFEKVVARSDYPRPEIVNMNAGECLMRKPDYTRAERYFRDALAVNPRLPAALYNMARLSYGSGTYLSARAYLERYFEVGRDTPRTLLLAVKTERQLGAIDLATNYSARLRTQFANSKEAEELEELDTQ